MTKYERDIKRAECAKVIEAAKKIRDAGGGAIKFVPEKTTQQGARLYAYIRKGV